MRHRLLLPVVLMLVAASCGVDRESVAPERSTTSPAGAAAADSATGESDADPAPTTSTTPAAPATTGAPGDVAVEVAFADGSVVEVLHGQLNDIIGPTQANQEFVDLVYRGQVPDGFDAIVLSQNVLGEVLLNELSKLDAEASGDDRDQAKTLLIDQLESLLITSDDPTADAERLFGEVPYLPFIVELQARQIALSSELVATAADDEGNPCVRHILVETEAEGDALQDELAGGTDFAQLAIERSTGPSGPNGGDLGCAPASNYVPEFAEAVSGAALGEFVGPIETQFGWHVLVVERYEIDGDQLAQQVLTEGLTAATVTVDQAVGEWDVNQLAIRPAGS